MNTTRRVLDVTSRQIRTVDCVTPAVVVVTGSGMAAGPPTDDPAHVSLTLGQITGADEYHDEHDHRRWYLWDSVLEQWCWSELSSWTAQSDGGPAEQLGGLTDSSSWNDAKRAAFAWVAEWADADVVTQWVDVLVTAPDGEERSFTYAVEPVEPECTESEHEWHEYEVHGHGGGVISSDRCRHCGVRRHTDTWAQRFDTGEQGLRSTSYEPPADDWEPAAEPTPPPPRASKPSSIQLDGCCSFCGDRRLVAISEATGVLVSICESCAAWAAEQIESVL